MESLLSLDTRLFLALNNDLGYFMDQLMWYVSKTWPWIPFYGLLIWILYKKYKGYVFMVVILAVALCVTLTDQVSTQVLKDSIMRLRPSREPAIQGLIHFVKDGNGNDYIGGMYGFVSSHAANYAGFITLFILLMRPLKRGIVLLLVFWALLVGYSRIYLGVHYPGDVLGGYMLGILIAFVIYRIFIALNEILSERNRKVSGSPPTS